MDIALHDLVGKLMNQPWYRIWGLDPGKTPNTSFTIGIDTPEVVREKVREAGTLQNSEGKAWSEERQGDDRDYTK